MLNEKTPNINSKYLSLITDFQKSKAQTLKVACETKKEVRSVCASLKILVKKLNLKMNVFMRGNTCFVTK